ncbi:MAG: hypothetical protein EAZ76_09630 [Nostocales cyanobacterium]|nr:MAG: hypothetical protein EAZ87_05135 [Nostocales cyanobacterium]TAF14440.1 MAG: hypothetical protein EAZ76_09630 [Nostocales cyanobacterium]
MLLPSSNTQSKTGKDFWLTLIFLLSSTGQWCYSQVEPSLASTPDEKISQEDTGLSLIYLTLAQSEIQNTELKNNYLRESSTPETVSNKSVTQEVKNTNTLQSVQPEFLYLELYKQLEPLVQKTESEKIKVINNTKLLTNSADFKIEAEEIKPLFSQSAVYLLDDQQNIDSITKSSQDQQELTQQVSEDEKLPLDPNEEQEIRLRVRPRPEEELPIPATEKPKEQFQPIGYLRGYAGYFHTDNIFSSNESKITDGLFYTGLTLASAYFPITPSTYINGSIDCSLIRYIDQSQFNYNQLRFNAGIYQQISPQMYAELNFSNQRLFYARNGDFFSAGERFLDEDSIRLSLGRRDNLTDKLTLDSFYELSANFSRPERRSRIINYVWLSLGYSVTEPLSVGLNYQFNFSDFTEIEREDQFHRIYAHLNYRTSDTSNVYLQGGYNLGGSTTPDIDFSGWFLSVNYGFELGRF